MRNHGPRIRTAKVSIKNPGLKKQHEAKTKKK
jgi:hypothetical protein